MSRVFLDSNIFIYLIEDKGQRGQEAAGLLSRMSLRRDEVITSALSYGEVLAKPIAEGRHDLVQLYETAFRDPGITVQSFDLQAAFRYAEIRADKSIKAPDAMQLAIAATARCDLFVTNDGRLNRKVIQGIQFITSMAGVPI